MRPRSRNCQRLRSGEIEEVALTRDFSGWLDWRVRDLPSSNISKRLTFRFPLLVIFDGFAKAILVSAWIFTGRSNQCCKGLPVGPSGNSNDHIHKVNYLHRLLVNPMSVRRSNNFVVQMVCLFGQALRVLLQFFNETREANRQKARGVTTMPASPDRPPFAAPPWPKLSIGELFLLESLVRTFFFVPRGGVMDYLKLGQYLSMKLLSSESRGWP